jgi:hypothetical protein
MRCEDDVCDRWRPDVAAAGVAAPETLGADATLSRPIEDEIRGMFAAWNAAGRPRERSFRTRSNGAVALFDAVFPGQPRGQTVLQGAAPPGGLARPETWIIQFDGTGVGPVIASAQVPMLRIPLTRQVFPIDVERSRPVVVRTRRPHYFQQGQTIEFDVLHVPLELAWYHREEAAHADPAHRVQFKVAEPMDDTSFSLQDAGGQPVDATAFAPFQSGESSGGVGTTSARAVHAGRRR